MSGGIILHRGSANDNLIVVRNAVASPPDSTPIFWGPNAATVSNAVNRIYVQRACRIQKVTATLFVSGPGTSEVSTMYLRVNDTTDYSIGAAFVTSAAFYSVVNNAMNITLAADDYFEFRWNTPAWVTNPAQVFMAAMVKVD